MIGNDVITIYGAIQFAPLSQPLPPGSCVHVSLHDASRMDVIWTTLTSSTLDAAGKTFLKYRLISPIPSRGPGRVYKLEVIVNVGWCSQRTIKGIQNGDYREVYPVKVDNSSDVYTIDALFDCYNCPSKYPL